MSHQRHLAAVMAADVVGFSALTGADEDGTFAALQALQQTADAIITGHGGRVANRAGDAIIAEFPSVAEAVDAAVEIQRSPEISATGIRLRIGVNLGDVIVTDDGDVFGDGVNVAARLETLASAGGIVVSGAVRDTLRGRSPIEFDDLGPQSLKNIDEPIRAFAARLHMEPTPTEPRRLDEPALLERAEELAVIQESMETAAGGRGHIVVVSGEAGIGKSALVRAAASKAPERMLVLWGWCDDLVTPRTLGPLNDMAASLGSAVARAIDESGRPEMVLRALHDSLADGTPRMLVIEDLHWADDATLDMLTFLGRRVQALRCVVAATVRDVAASRVRAALAEAPPGTVIRLPLAPLSAAAVASLVGSAAEAERLRRLTGGNPFFLSELAAGHTEEIPESVQDVVMARLGRLSPPARRVAEAVSVGPTSLEVDVVATMVDDAASGFDEAVQHGMLVVEGNRSRFRHELARRAAEAALPESERRRLHQAALSALSATGADPARLVHHADGAGDTAALVAHSLAAADAASAMGAHRQAAEHYRRALDHDGLLDPSTLEDALDAFSLESYVLGHGDDARDSRLRLLEIRRSRGDRIREGDDLRWISRFHWLNADGRSARETARQAVQILEPLGPSRELAMALSNVAQLAMLGHERDEALMLGENALEMARIVDDEETAIHALTNLGTVVGNDDLELGVRMLVDARDRAIAAGLHEPASRASVNMAWNMMLAWQWDRAKAELDQALGFATDHEVMGMVSYMRALLAWIALDTGDWEAATALTHDASRGLPVLGVAAVPIQQVLGLLHARRGELDEAKRVAEAAWSVAGGTGEPQRIGPIAALLGEIAWLEERDPDLDTVLRPAYRRVVRVRYHRFAGDLSRWLRFAGEDVSAADHIEPYASEVDGRFGEAADRWSALGMPYYEALARYEAGEPDRAMDILERLGAHGTLARVAGGD